MCLLLLVLNHLAKYFLFLDFEQAPIKQKFLMPNSWLSVGWIGNDAISPIIGEHDPYIHVYVRVSIVLIVFLCIYFVSLNWWFIFIDISFEFIWRRWLIYGLSQSLWALSCLLPFLHQLLLFSASLWQLRSLRQA